MSEVSRRSLITGLVAFVAAPAIVRAESLMKVTGDRYFFWQYRWPLLPPIRETDSVDYVLDRVRYFGPNGRLYEGTWTFFGKDRNIYSDDVIAFSKQEYPA